MKIMTLIYARNKYFLMVMPDNIILTNIRRYTESDISALNMIDYYY